MGENFFSILFYSFYIFEGNYVEFKRTIESYIEDANSDCFIFDGDKQIDLNINGGREISRRIHNYAASWLSLVDHTRRVQRKLKDHASTDIQNFANEYETRLSKNLMPTFENIFVKDLRNYIQHKGVPVPTLRLTLHQAKNMALDSDGTSLQGSYSFEINSSEFDTNFEWKPKSKEYLKNNRSVPIVTIIDQHFSAIRDFYRWIQFRDHQLHPYAPREAREITFEDWKQKTMECEA